MGKQQLFDGLGEGHIVAALPVKREVAAAGPRLQKTLCHLAVPCKPQDYQFFVTQDILCP